MNRLNLEPQFGIEALALGLGASVKGEKSVGSVEVPAHVSAEEVAQSTVKLNKVMEAFDTGMSFSYNQKLDRYQVSIINKDTGELIKKIPSDELMQLAENIQDSLSGIFVDRRQ